LIVRDRDVLVEASRRARVVVHFSIPTLDLDVWRATEPGTAPPHQRLRALRMLVDAGIDAGVGMAPILPGISDKKEQLEAVVRAAREAGATRIWASLLYLKPGTREHFLETLAAHWPEELERYEALFLGRAYLERSKAEPVLEAVAALRKRYAIADRRVSPIQPPEDPVQLEFAV